MAVTRMFWFLFATLVLATTMAACGGGDDDGGDPPPTPTIGGSATGAAATPTPPSLAGPAHFLYTVSPGDTLASIADSFDGVPGEGDAPSEDDLATLNGIRPSQVTAGMQLLVPLVLTDPDGTIPSASIAEALGLGSDAGALALLQPGEEMRSGYLGRIALHGVELADGNPAAEGYGYRIEYYGTDRPATKGGVADPAARFDSLLFVVAGGALTSKMEAGEGQELYAFERDGVSYAVLATAEAELSGERIAGMLVTTAER